MQSGLSESGESGQRSRGPRRLVAYGFACSGALHVALFLIASFGSCLGPVVPTTSEASASLVSIEVSAPVPAPPAPALPRSTPPGGGVPVRHALHPKWSYEPAAPPPAVPGPAAAAPESPAEPPVIAEATSADDVEVSAASDSKAPVAAVARAPDAGVSAISSATPAAAGTGRGAHGGPGGYGRGPGGGRLPAVTQKFALGGDTGDFKAVVCFIQPGTLRIADIRRCDPVAVFYTDTFDIPERQFTQGFPGVTGRSSWFMVDYRGSFNVSQEGAYRFRLHSDDGSYLYIDDSLVIENDGKHEPMSAWGGVYLKPGHHQLKLLYAQTVDRMALQLFVRMPGAWNEKLFTSEL
jgi:PA14 domain-containing protein